MLEGKQLLSSQNIETGTFLSLEKIAETVQHK